MKNIKRIVGIAVIIAVVAGVAISAGMVKKTPEAVQNMAIGKIFGTDITVSQIEPRMQQIYGMISQQVQGNPMDNPQAKEMIVKAREQAVNGVMTEKVFENQIKEQKIVPTQAEIDKAYQGEIDRFITNAKGDKTKGMENFNAALKQSGLTEATLKAQIVPQLAQQLLIEKLTKDLPKITDADAQSYYNENKTQYVDKAAGAEVYQVVVGSKEEADKLRTQYLAETKGMTDVNQKLAVFEKIATANNTDGTKETKGKLGFIDYNSKSVVPAFAAAVDSLKKAGDLSEVVNSQGTGQDGKPYNVYNFAFAASVVPTATYKSFDDEKATIIKTMTQQQESKVVQPKITEWEKAAGGEVYTSKLNYAVPTPSTTQGGQTAN
ncbi:SurA N-terminal domain-containing protein [uncultured Clostridium sp.]|jgi:foldase protein PrsA|uniref:SurA N-terminal domain-containing protein n=1 Tax=uncultured Clostridium sp. TaxID=59620 RepID=UPI00261C9E70|nr:SurA N-terminal domain-containing protein [uncultured Clostridium sp.]